MTKVLFYLVRHGETFSNEDNCYRGWSNGPQAQLDPAGREGVREAGIFLLSAGLSFPLVVSDDLDRAQETQDILADILNIQVAETEPLLRPLNVGDFTGKPKAEYPLDKYIEDKDLRIPGGDTLNEFNRQQAATWDGLTSVVEKIGKPILVVVHGSNVSFLHNHRSIAAGEKVGYEGLVHPSGVLMFTTEGIIPLTKKRGATKSPLKDGTALTGFVTANQNHPPRDCWNCNAFVRDVNGLGACRHPLVMIDPELQDRKQTDGTIAVGDNDCCDNFRHKVST